MKTKLLAACLATLLSTPVLAADAEALAAVSAVNDHEIKAAALAIEKGVDGDVKDYAQMMDKEHSTNQEQVGQVSKKAGIAPTETDKVAAMKKTKQAERDAMGKLDGAAFESAYVDAMVKDHAEVLAKLDKELIPAASNADVAAHLKATRGHVAMHLEKAQALDAADGK
jgi:putative membrane protein